MSTVTLTDEDLHAMQELASNSLRDSLIEYRRLLSALREKCPTLTDAAISEIGKRGDDSSLEYAAALACSYYKVASQRGMQCIRLLRAGRADGEVIRHLRFADSGVWRALGAMAIVLNGGSLAQSFISDQLGAIRSQNASHAANKKLDQPGGYREKHGQMRAEWATGKYASRDDCARRECEAVGLSYSAARRALRRTAEPSRT